jgi:hypothetical protein
LFPKVKRRRRGGEVRRRRDEAAAKGGDNDRERPDCYYALFSIEVECPPFARELTAIGSARTARA